MTIKKVLVSQPQPTSEKSPYYDIASSMNVDIVFRPFIKVESLTPRDFILVYIAQGNEVLLVLMLVDDGQQAVVLACGAEEDLALAVLDVLLDVEGYGFGNAKVFHVLGQRDAQLFTQREEKVDSVARIEDNGRVIENLDLLGAKFAGCESLYLDKRVERECHILLGFNLEVGRLFGSGLRLRNKNLLDHLLQCKLRRETAVTARVKQFGWSVKACWRIPERAAK